MNHRGVYVSKKATISAVFAIAVSGLALLIPLLHAQKEEMQARVAELKESMAKNKQALAQYTWHETDTIKLKGEVKKTSNFQVRMGPDGKPQKTSLDAPPQAQQQSGGRGGRLKEKVVENKKEEYKEYGDDMKALAAQYVPPDKDAIQAAQAKGNISITPSSGSPSEVKLVIKDYAKPGDSMTLLFDKAQKQLLSITIATYMKDPKDAMNLAVQFSKLPDGTNYTSSTNVEGVSKQLTVIMQNSDYQKI